MIFIAFIELWNWELDESPGMQLICWIVLCVQNVARVTINRPDDLKIVTTSYLGNFTLGISAFTKCVHLQEIGNLCNNRRDYGYRWTNSQRKHFQDFTPSPADNVMRCSRLCALLAILLWLAFGRPISFKRDIESDDGDENNYDRNDKKHEWNQSLYSGWVVPFIDLELSAHRWICHFR